MLTPNFVLLFGGTDERLTPHLSGGSRRREGEGQWTVVGLYFDEDEAFEAFEKWEPTRGHGEGRLAIAQVEGLAHTVPSGTNPGCSAASERSKQTKSDLFSWTDPQDDRGLLVRLRAGGWGNDNYPDVMAGLVIDDEDYPLGIYLKAADLRGLRDAITEILNDGPWAEKS